ncbi:hypothetical protein KIN20_001168 [Parelaphostrongylus tenuis]|uniref:Uncharacterized protein n=1 Tax=Parelaphostrongylus tenuis TaxID=148309 RepID=A0AAD5QC24_PARTN|nr:hypothetical protein KIN20_001168 [Parelaphostrongylus tenuis]
MSKLGVFSMPQMEKRTPGFYNKMSRTRSAPQRQQGIAGHNAPVHVVAPLRGGEFCHEGEMMHTVKMEDLRSRQPHVPRIFVAYPHQQEIERQKYWAGSSQKEDENVCEFTALKKAMHEELQKHDRL